MSQWSLLFTYNNGQNNFKIFLSFVKFLSAETQFRHFLQENNTYKLLYLFKLLLKIVKVICYLQFLCLFKLIGTEKSIIHVLQGNSIFFMPKFLKVFEEHLAAFMKLVNIIFMLSKTTWNKIFLFTQNTFKGFFSCITLIYYIKYLDWDVLFSQNSYFIGFFLDVEDLSWHKSHLSFM